MGSQNAAKRKALEKSFKKQRGKCHLCGEPMNMSKDLNNDLRATADHIIPKSQGGAIDGNIRAAHAICNRYRGNRPIYEFDTKASELLKRQDL